MIESVYLRPAGPGEVWVLTHQQLPHFEWVDTFVDPYRAMQVLAERIRKCKVPLPENDFAAIAQWFRHPGSGSGAAHGEGFNLQLLQADTGVAARAAEEHVLVLPYQEWVCLCGNDAGLDGFDACTAAGDTTDQGPVPGYEHHHRCTTCGRIIDNDTGRVLGRRTTAEG